MPPHVPGAWIDRSRTQIGYEISFTRHFYEPTPLRSLEEIKTELMGLRAEAEGLLDEIVAPDARPNQPRKVSFTIGASDLAIINDRFIMAYGGVW